MEEILVIHHVREMHDTIQKIFGEAYYVEPFYRGLDAYTWIQSGHLPDLIICNDNLPDLKPSEMIQSFKNSGYYSEIPILILSSNPENVAASKLLDIGADDMVAYPLDLKELEISVQNILLKR